MNSITLDIEIDLEINFVVSGAESLSQQTLKCCSSSEVMDWGTIIVCRRFQCPYEGCTGDHSNNVRGPWFLDGF